MFSPAEITPEQQLVAESIASTLLTKLDVIGILGIEFFLTKTGKVLINEIAPRTHNSGHYTIDACETSQFEMHLRAITGLPLGCPKLKTRAAVMVNLLGYEYSHQDYQRQRQQLSALEQAHVHWYNKTESRPGRKLGHVTVLLTSTSQEPQTIAHKVESIWTC